MYMISASFAFLADHVIRERPEHWVPEAPVTLTRPEEPFNAPLGCLDASAWLAVFPAGVNLYQLLSARVSVQITTAPVPPPRGLSAKWIARHVLNTASRAPSGTTSGGSRTICKVIIGPTALWDYSTAGVR